MTENTERTLDKNDLKAMSIFSILIITLLPLLCVFIGIKDSSINSTMGFFLIFDFIYFAIYFAYITEKTPFTKVPKSHRTIILGMVLSAVIASFYFPAPESIIVIGSFQIISGIIFLIIYSIECFKPSQDLKK